MKRIRRSHKEVEALRRKAVVLSTINGHDDAVIASKLKVSRRTVCRYISDTIQNRLGKKRQSADANNAGSHIGVPPRSRFMVGTIETIDRAGYALTLARMSPRQRRTFIRYFIEGYNATEIAQFEGLCRSAITRRIIRIRKAFINAGLPEPKHLTQGRRLRIYTGCNWNNV